MRDSLLGAVIFALRYSRAMIRNRLLGVRHLPAMIHASYDTNFSTFFCKFTKFSIFFTCLPVVFSCSRLLLTAPENAWVYLPVVWCPGKCSSVYLPLFAPRKSCRKSNTCRKKTLKVSAPHKKKPGISCGALHFFRMVIRFFLAALILVKMAITGKRLTEQNLYFSWESAELFDQQVTIGRTCGVSFSILSVVCFATFFCFGSTSSPKIRKKKVPMTTIRRRKMRRMRMRRTRKRMRVRLRMVPQNKETFFVFPWGNNSPLPLPAFFRYFRIEIAG